MKFDHPDAHKGAINKKYNLRPGTLTITWRLLSGIPHYGNMARYIKMGYRTNERPDFYLRNPHAKPLLHNGKKSRKDGR